MHLCLLLPFSLLGSVSLFAQDEFSAPVREVPIVTLTPSRDTPYTLTLAPLTQQRTTVGTNQADATAQSFGVGFEHTPFDLVTLSYYSGADIFRQDTEIFDDFGETSHVLMSWVNKPSLALKLPGAWTLIGSAQTQSGLADDQLGASQAVKYGAALAWSPFQDVMKWQAATSTQETHASDATVSLQNVYTVSVQQKLPAVPVTLSVATSWTENRVELLPERDQDTTKIDAALLWKIRPEATWSGGVQSQDAFSDLAQTAETSRAWFTQIALQPTPPLSFTLRVAREDHLRSAEGRLLSSDPALALGFGLNFKLSEQFGAGFGVQYRVPETQASTTPLPSFSLTGSAKF